MSNLSVSELEELSDSIRTSTFRTILNAGSGHLGACSSSSELMTSLYFGGVLAYNPSDPDDPLRDRVYVRGHVGPLRYKIFSLLGWIDEEELKDYRKFGSRLKGHESMTHMPGVDITPSGSLGMLLSYGAGAAYMTKFLGADAKHFVFLGDGEEQEGNISEAARHIASIGLENVICVLDQNKKQLSRPTKDVDAQVDVSKIWSGYGWNVTEIDGHNIPQILHAYKEAISDNRPHIIVAKTVKGKGIPDCESHYSGFHTIGTCNKGVLAETIISREISDVNGLERINPETSPRKSSVNSPDLESVTYDIQIKPESNNNLNLDRSQSSYFNQLAIIAREKGMPFFFLTPDLVPKDEISLVSLDKINGYLDTGIREQHTIAMAHGMSQTYPNARIFINYFDAFLYRASDQLNAAAQGRSRVILLSEMSGLTQGKNGESHQSSGQPAVPIMMPGVDFYEPADVKDLYNVFNYALSNNPGMVVIRSHRADINPLNRDQLDETNISYYKTFEPMSGKARACLVGSGYPVGAMVEAAKKLDLENIPIRVINVINQKKLDSSFVSLLEPGCPVLTVYNGNPQILQSSVSRVVMESSNLRPSKIKGHGFYFGDTGSIEDLTKAYQLDSEGIISVIQREFGKI